MCPKGVVPATHRGAGDGGEGGAAEAIRVHALAQDAEGCSPGPGAGARRTAEEREGLEVSSARLSEMRAGHSSSLA